MRKHRADNDKKNVRNSMTTREIIGRIGAILLGMVLVWRVLVSGLGEYDAAQDAPEVGVDALHWRGDQATALYRQSLVLIAQGDPAAAHQRLQAAAWANPADALIYLALAELAVKADQASAAIALVKTADQLGPMRTPALARSAVFWLARQRPDLALARWDMLLRNRPKVGELLYPVLLRWAENIEDRALLRPLLAHPPPWWDRFFAYATTQSTHLETVIFLYRNRERGGKLPEATEQKAYLERLWREEHWLEAYLTWLGGLDENQQRGLANLYNGGFELPVTGIGFDWWILAPRGALVEVRETGGAHGAALHVAFDGQRVHFQHVRQPLYLRPGHYRLQGRVRPENLRTERGIHWAVRCVASEDRLLTEDLLFVGSSDWRSFSQDFRIPETGCPVQWLRLELEGQAALDFEVRGGIWFDDLAIVQQD